jgi:hypothetical protein
MQLCWPRIFCTTCVRACTYTVSIAASFVTRRTLTLCECGESPAHLASWPRASTLKIGYVLDIPHQPWRPDCLECTSHHRRTATLVAELDVLADRMANPLPTIRSKHSETAGCSSRVRVHTTNATRQPGSEANHGAHAPALHASFKILDDLKPFFLARRPLTTGLVAGTGASS